MFKSWRVWFGLAVSVVFVLIAVRNLKLEEVWQNLLHAQYVWLIPSIATYFVAVGLRTWRWHYMLRPLKPISLSHLFPIVCIGYMGNNIYPARAGELLRAYVLKRKEGISISASLATVVVERLFDGVTMLLFVFIALPFVPMPAILRQIVIVFSLLFFGALLIFFIIAARPERTQRIYSWLVTHALPSRFQELAHGVFDRFISGLHSLRSGREVLMIFITSLGIWLAETVKYWFVLHAFSGADVPFIVLMLMNGVVNLATTIPSSPGYVGTFDLPGIEILVAYGVSRDVATAYTAVLHAALWLPITLLGAFFMWREHLSVPQITREVREEEEAAPAGAQ